MRPAASEKYYILSLGLGQYFSALRAHVWVKNPNGCGNSAD